MLRRMPRPRARLAVPVALALALAAAPALGCGGEPETIAGRTLTVELTEYRLEPQDVRVRAGRLRLVAVNRGQLPHNLHVVREDPEDRERTPDDLGGTATAQPGDTRRHTFTNLRAGQYRIVCTVGNHDDLGMYGTLEVVAARDRSS